MPSRTGSKPVKYPISNDGSFEQLAGLVGVEVYPRSSRVAHVLLVFVDWLPVVVSEHLPREQADRLAAVASRLASLPTGVAQLFERWAGAAIRGRDAKLLLLSVIDAC